MARTIALVGVALALGACATHPALRVARRPASPADVIFLQGMITHHAQALDMAALVPDRSTRPDLQLLAKKIAVSQTDEIASMRRWLEAHGADAPDAHAHHTMTASGALMPGMLTDAEMTRMAAAKGDPFDRLFLDGMIAHHEGALTMVRTLFATAGAAEDSDVFAFASDVEADQRMEIDRMRQMRAARAR